MLDNGIRKMKVEIKIDKKVLFSLLEQQQVNGYIIPVGFVTDFASVPRSLWNILPPIGKHNRAALLHDYLYTENIGSRKKADELFLAVMIEDGVSVFTAWIMYLGVRIGGSKAWRNKGVLKR